MTAKLPRINKEREQTAANILSHCPTCQFVHTPRDEIDEVFKSYNLGGEGFLKGLCNSAAILST